MQGDEVCLSQGHVATLFQHLSLLEGKKEKKRKRKKKHSLPPRKCLITVPNHHLTSPCIRDVCVHPNG
jgi:hypothetical protein